MCFSLFKHKRIRVYEEMRYGEFYNKYSKMLMPYATKAEFLRENRYRRLCSRDVIRGGDVVVIPKKRVI
jgi:hypothetical protein